MKILDLFSGIGGFSLGLEKAGFQTSAFCEIDSFCQKVLKQHWPDVPIYNDVSKVSRNQLEQDGITDIEIITGGFPCQDLSCAGTQKGINNGTRSGLWWEMQRIISEIRPKFAIMENVPNFLSGERGDWFAEFLGSLAEIGYNAQWHCISAAAVGSPHVRERVWIIAYPKSIRMDVGFFEQIQLSQKLRSDWESKEYLYINSIRYSYPEIPEHLRVDDGLSFELDEIKQRIKACGNSIVPEIAYQIGLSIKQFENKN